MVTLNFLFMLLININLVYSITGEDVGKRVIEFQKHLPGNKFPTETNNILNSQFGTNHSCHLEKTLSHMSQTNVIIHPEIVKFLDDDMKSNVRLLLKTLFENRAIFFCGATDTYMLQKIEGGQYVSDFDEDQYTNYETKVNGAETTLNELVERKDGGLSYNQLLISPLLGISGPSCFINNCGRFNMAELGKPGQYVKEGIVIGLVGARFERSHKMESSIMLIDVDQLFYPQSLLFQGVDTPLIKKMKEFYGVMDTHFTTLTTELFSKPIKDYLHNIFYGIGEQLTDELNNKLYCPEIKYRSFFKDGYPDKEKLSQWAAEWYNNYKINSNKPNWILLCPHIEWFPGCNSVEHYKRYFLHVPAFIKRMKMSYELFLIEAQVRAAQNPAQQAYCHIVGLGTGVWAKDAIFQETMIVNIVKEILSTDDALVKFSNIGVVDFSYFNINFEETLKIIFGKEPQVVDGVQELKLKDKFIIRFSNRNPADLIPNYADHLLVIMYAWDGGSFVGNEYWPAGIEGNEDWLRSSGDPAQASCSTIPYTQNPKINSDINYVTYSFSAGKYQLSPFVDVKRIPRKLKVDNDENVIYL